MSWMDSWSRPGKSAAVPPPLYLTAGEDVPYCKTCGRVMSRQQKSRKQQEDNVVKYCSERCRTRKPANVDRRIEALIVSLLNGEPDSGIDKTAAKSKLIKGDKRLLVTCDEIEELFFGSRFDPEKTFGRKKNRASRAIGTEAEGDWKSVDMEGTDSDASQSSVVALKSIPKARTGPLIRPPQHESDVNASVGGEKSHAERKEETAEALAKRREGDRRAEEHEMVRRAARRGIVFGFLVDEPEDQHQRSGKQEYSRTTKQPQPSEQVQSRRKCEAVMNGSVVEPSFAKGNWSIRWRE